MTIEVVSMQNKTIARRAGIAWICAMGAASIILNVYKIWQLYLGNDAAVSLFSWYHFVVACFVVFVSLPLLIIICHYSKQANLKGIMILSVLGIFHHVLWLALGLIQWIEQY